MGIKSSASEPIENNEAAKKVSRYISNKFSFSNMFYLKRMGKGNDDISSVEYFENSKTS
jgi:hypothetical protein